MRKRHLARPSDVEDAANAGPQGELDCVDDVPFVDDLHHRVEAHHHHRTLEPKVVAGGVVDSADDVARPKDDGLGVGLPPKEALGEHVQLDKVAHAPELLGPQQRRVLGEELWIVGLRAVDVGPRKHDELRNLVLRHVVEQLLKGDDIPGVALAIASPRVVKDAEVNDRANVAAAEDVFHLFATHVDLMMEDVLGTVVEWAPIDANDAIGAMELPNQKPAEAPADAGHQDRTVGGRLGALARRWLGLGLRLLDLNRRLVRMTEHAARHRRPC